MAEFVSAASIESSHLPPAGRLSPSDETNVSSSPRKDDFISSDKIFASSRSSFMWLMKTNFLLVMQAFLGFFNVHQEQYPKAHEEGF